MKKLLVIFFVIIAGISIAFSFRIYASLRSYEQALNGQTVANVITSDTYQRRLIADDYLLNATSRAKQQWVIEQSQLSNYLQAHASDFNAPAEKQYVQQIKSSLSSSSATFAQLAQIYDSNNPISDAEKAIFSAQFGISVELTVSAASQLSTYNQIAANQALQHIVGEFIMIAGIFAVVLLGCFVVIWIGSDRLERKNKLEEAILSSIGDGVFAIDTSGKIILFNKVAEMLTGYRGSHVVGKPYQEVLQFANEQTGALQHGFIRSALLGKMSSIPSNTVLKQIDGATIPVADSSAPIVNRKDDVIGAVVVFRDVTRERQIENAKDEFISLASHQLKSPPTSINWDLELLLGGDVGRLNKEQENLLQTMKTSTENMIEVVAALLNISRIELGTFIVNPEPVDLVALAKSILKEQEKAISDKKLKVIQKYSENMPKIPADPGLAKIIIENLVTNAVKYTREKGSMAINIQNNKQTVTIKVEDSGYGIPKDEQDQIFTKMYRAKNIREKAEGTGLGLYLLKKIVEQVARGKIWFESKENRGTTFYIELPKQGMSAKAGTSRLT